MAKWDSYLEGKWAFWPKAGLAKPYESGPCYDTPEEALAQADWPTKPRPKSHYRLVRLHRVSIEDVR